MKARKDSPKLIMGKDIGFEQFLDFLSMAIVRRFYGKTVSRNSLQQWITTNWEALFGYAPISTRCCKGGS